MYIKIPCSHFPDMTHVKIKVFYDKGGAGCNGRVDPRGIWFLIHPVKVDGLGEKFMAYSGFKVFLLALPRMNAKKLKEIYDKIEAKADRIVELFVADDKIAIAEVLQNEILPVH